MDRGITPILDVGDGLNESLLLVGKALLGYNDGPVNIQVFSNRVFDLLILLESLLFADEDVPPKYSARRT